MRTANVNRKTRETDIQVDLNLDGSGNYEIDTGIGFFDHMLTQVAVHGLFDLVVNAKGDLHIDAHHTVEDCGIALGQAFLQALGEKRGIVRFGSATVPMDDALGQVVIDFSGRPYAVIKVDWKSIEVGGLPPSLLEHFFESFAAAGNSNVHVIAHYGRDGHHIAESLFKAFGRALAEAASVRTHASGTLPSSKEML
jgi:imidazoleglycerol phosphate dehydratase HisB